MRMLAFSLAAVFAVWTASSFAEGTRGVTVRAEEDVYNLVSPDNGSGPLWSYGCSVIARSGDDVVASQMETGEGVPKLCNTRWRLLHRTPDGWTCLAETDGYRQREPCPLAVLPGERIYLSVNDSTQPPGTMYGPCVPHLLEFVLGGDMKAPVNIAPAWAGETYFTDHSYRSYCADREAERLLLFNIDAKTSIQHWCLLSATGETLRSGQIEFPIRACYPQTALTRGAAHIVAVGDIVEPVQEWREYKFSQTQQKWDYVFRILYYAHAPDISKGDFGAPIEIANVDATGGHITNQDLWISPRGEAYILYSQRDVQSELMREKFFPDKTTLDSLHLAIVENGAVRERRVLMGATPERQPGCARFHEAADGTLYIVLNVSGTESGNKLMQALPVEENPALVPIPFEQPFTAFCTASPRAGNLPSDTIDLFGHRARGDKLSYGQVVLTPAG